MNIHVTSCCRLLLFAPCFGPEAAEERESTRRNDGSNLRRTLLLWIIHEGSVIQNIPKRNDRHMNTKEQKRQQFEHPAPYRDEFQHSNQHGTNATDPHSHVLDILLMDHNPW